MSESTETNDDDCKENNHLKRLKDENAAMKLELEKLQGCDSFIVGQRENPLVVVTFMKKGLSDAYKSEIEKSLQLILKKELPVQVECESEDGFFIDSTSSDHNNIKLKAPIYRVEMNGVLTDKVDETEKILKLENKPRSTCFNCCGDHMISECPKPLDRQSIAQNRKEFYSKFGGKQSRYHVEVDPQFAKYKPGVLSSELRKALNLRDNHLPPFIYRMRTLGYPPGWLEEACVESSGITMYDSQGKEVENLEDGEVSEPGTVRVQYDPSRLMEYPGFNVYPEPGMIDESEKLGFPPIQHIHLISTLQHLMKSPDATPFKRKTESELSMNKKALREEEDMEIDDQAAGSQVLLDGNEDSCKFIAPLPRDQPQDLPPPPPPPSASDGCSRPSSPSLESLEVQKQRLLMQLEEDSPRGSPRPTRSESKSLCLGTPIVAAANSEVMLPTPDKFAKGISEHMDFENLPNSIGSFDKMRVLLDTVRQKMKL